MLQANPRHHRARGTTGQQERADVSSDSRAQGPGRWASCLRRERQAPRPRRAGWEGRTGHRAHGMACRSLRQPGRVRTATLAGALGLRWRAGGFRRAFRRPRHQACRAR